MTVKRKSDRTFGQFLPSGTVPLSANGNETFTVAGTPGAGTSWLRTRTDIELYVVAGGGTTDVNLSFAYETLIAVGVEMFPSTAGEMISDTPFTTTPNPASTGWAQWEYLYPEIQFVNVNVPQLVVVTWRPHDKTIDTQTRRAVPVGVGLDIWMPWDVQDGSGLINTTDAGGNTYHLGARFAQAIWWEVKS